jgi:diguanylate cyclase (GGDEF)-like protein
MNAARLARLGAFECDLATGALTWTDEVYDLFGLPVGIPLTRQDVLGQYTEASRQELELRRAAALCTQRGFSFDAQIRRGSHEYRWMRVTVDVVSDKGRPVRIYGAKQDITNERLALDRLRQMAENDHLTGLANRALFDAHYQAMMADEIRFNHVGALALVDLDRFKAINDTLGHAAGDECLRQTALRLQRCFADAQLIARLGGDEFAVFLRAPLAVSRLQDIIARALKTLARPIVWDGHVFDVSASIGAAMLDQRSSRIDLFAEADFALYAAKSAGRGVARLFNAALSKSWDAQKHQSVA